jgi:N6-L-threonylcarbamoyladenine synthase
MRVLGLETSCDETAAAVVTEGGLVLSDVVHSQIALHAPYGGVVPELAARDHTRVIEPVVREALARAALAPQDLDGIAVTTQPGLAGALMVGVQVAKGLAWALEKPLVGVDHLVGHLLAVFLRRGDCAVVPAFPFVALLVSGGHSALYRVEGPTLGDITELGATRDDAAGEAFDKVAKLLGLPYPGGPAVDRLAAQGDAARGLAEVPLVSALPGTLELSFSGMKSAMARYVAARGAPPEGALLADLCAAFQATVVRTLVSKTLRAAREEGLPRIVVAGGVAANRGLRAELARAAEADGRELFVPAFASCTDNAAMIAYAGALRLARGEQDGVGLALSPRTALLRVTRKGRGRR